MIRIEITREMHGYLSAIGSAKAAIMIPSAIYYPAKWITTWKMVLAIRFPLAIFNISPLAVAIISMCIPVASGI